MQTKLTAKSVTSLAVDLWLRFGFKNADFSVLLALVMELLPDFMY
jgi:hypothetical protein